jgi:hypothetical protein
MLDLSRRYAKVFQELGETVAVLANHADDEWCSSIVLAKGLFRSEAIKGLDCAIGIRRVTVSGEIARIDLNLDDIGFLELRNEIIPLAKLAIEPRLIGFGNIVFQDSAEGFVIILPNRNDAMNRHDKLLVQIR